MALGLHRLHGLSHRERRLSSCEGWLQLHVERRVHPDDFYPARVYGRGGVYDMVRAVQICTRDLNLLYPT